MAFMIASGAKPENGIYTAIVAGLIVSVFGGTRVQIAGPTGAFIVIIAGITAKIWFFRTSNSYHNGRYSSSYHGYIKIRECNRFYSLSCNPGFTAGIG